jgi:hypothetical protein
MKRDQSKQKAGTYAVFLSGNESVPESVFTRVRSDLEGRMKPGFLRVLFEILKTQIILGALTLLVCPQFGVGPLGGGDGLMGWVESYGHLVCGLYCGTIFVGLNVIYSRFFLSLDYKNAIRAEPLLPFAVLGVISFLLILIVSTMWNETVPHLHAEFVGAWLSAFVVTPLLGLRFGFRRGFAE